MRPTVTDRVAWSVGLSVCHTSELPLNFAKSAEAMEIPFGFRTRVGPRNHVLHGVQIYMGRGHFGDRGAYCKV